MAILVRRKLNKLARTNIGALTVTDVHARDVGIKMINNGVSTVTDFDCGCLNYGTCIIRMMVNNLFGKNEVLLIICTVKWLFQCVDTVMNI
jgi:NADH/NAD ratio-sensing transcriptional regulator Rex